MDLETLYDTIPIYQIGFSLLFLLVYFILNRLLSRSIFRRALLYKFEEARSAFIRKILRSLLLILLLVSLGFLWQISLRGLSIYLASFAAIAGVALFATWSVLSNITSAVILFFFFPFRIGSKVRIIDGDNSIEGTVLGLSLFSIHIQTDKDNEVYCPNSLAMQKAIVYLKD